MLDILKKIGFGYCRNVINLLGSWVETVRYATSNDEEIQVAFGFALAISTVLGAVIMHLVPVVVPYVIAVVMYFVLFIIGIINIVAHVSNDEPWLKWDTEFFALFGALFIVFMLVLFFGWLAGLPLAIIF